MFATPRLYKCPKCGHKEVRMMGDAMKMEDFFPTCPVCGERLKRANIWDRFLYRWFGKDSCWRDKI